MSGAAGFAAQDSDLRKAARALGRQLGRAAILTARDSATITMPPQRRTIYLPTFTMTSPHVIWPDIVSVSVGHYEISLEDFFSERRHPKVVLARRAYVWLCRKLTCYSYSDIARYGNRPTHSTCMSQHRIACARYASDPAYRAELDGLEAELRPAVSGPLGRVNPPAGPAAPAL